MSTERKPKAFFTLNLPRKPEKGDVIKIVGKLRKNPEEFKVTLGVKTTDDRNTSIEPKMIAFEFKTVFLKNDIKVTTNWKTDTGWHQEEVIDSDWIDSKGNVHLTLTFDKDYLLITDKGANLITNFHLKFELERISRLQLWGNVKELREISLKYNQLSKLRRSPRKKT